jgi:hypothetical protein
LEFYCFIETLQEKWSLVVATALKVVAIDY